MRLVGGYLGKVKMYNGTLFSFLTKRFFNFITMSD